MLQVLRLPPNGDIWLAGSTPDKIYKSTDGGANWGTGISGPSGQSSIEGIAIAANGHIWLAGSSPDRVYRSTNNGSTWSNAITGPRGQTIVTGIAVAPNGDLWLVGTTPDDVYKSTNNGSTWSSSGISGPSGQDIITGIGFDPRVASVAPIFSDATGDALSGLVGEAITDVVVPAASGTPTPTYAVQGSLPAGLSFNTSTRTISGTPTSSGSGTITIRATNAGGHADWTAAYNFAADLTPSAPTLSDQTGVVNTAVDITLPVGTGGNSPLAYAIANLPSGLTFNTSTRKITGTPTTEETNTVTYTVTDADSDADSETFTFTIGPEDLTPSAPTLSDQTGVVNTAVDITLPVGTGGNSPLSYAIANLPSGLTFNTSTRKITGTPTTEETNTVTYTVTDADSDADSETFTFTISGALGISDWDGARYLSPIVLARLSATISGADITVNPVTEIEGDLVVASDLTVDVVRRHTGGTEIGLGRDGSANFSKYFNSSGSPQYPTAKLFIVINDANKTHIPATIWRAGGSWSVWRIDNRGQASLINAIAAGDQFLLAIAEPDLTPSAPTVANQTGVVNTAVDITLPVGTGGNSPLSYAIANLPSGLTFNTSTRKITGTPTTAETNTVTYTVTDADSDADSETFTFTIGPEDLTPSAPTLSDQTGAVNTAVDITLPVGTGGNSPLAYAIANLPAGLSFNTSTRKITGTPTTEETNTVTYTVTDADSDADSETFTFTISPEDLTPVAPTLSDQTGIVNTAVDITLPVGTGGNSPLAYAIANLPSGLTFNTSTRKITGTPTTAETNTVTYTVTDADSDADSETFTFTIGPEDLTPVAPTLSDQTGAAGTAVNILLPVGTGGNSPLSYAISNLPDGLSFDGSTRRITGTPTTDQVKTVTYTVTDADNDVDSETFTFTITSDFRVSSWDGTDYLSPIVLARLSATISGADITVDPVTALEGDLVVASDLTVKGVERYVNGTQIRLRKTGSANFNKYFNNSGSPQYRTAKLFIVLNDVGKTHIPFTVANNGGGFSNWNIDDSSQNSLINAIATGNQFLLAIAEPDLTPVLPTVSDQTGIQNTAYTPLLLPVGTSGNGTLTYSIANLPAGLAFDASTRGITGTPTTPQVKTVTYTVTDEDGSADSREFTFTIAADLVPSAPTVADQTGAVNTAVDITLPVGTGGDGTLVYSIANLPAGLSFNVDTRKITGTPTTEESKTVTYTVTDADGDADSETFTFTISPEDLTPSAPTLSDQTGAVNTAVDITLPVGTGGDGALAYSIANLPGGLSFNTSTRKITGTPSTAETNTVTYTVTDADGDTDSETFTFTINPDLVPSAPSLSDQTGAVNTAVDITLPVGTGGDGALAYSIANLPGGLSFNTSTRKITGTPTAAQVKTVTYTITDADGDSNSETFTFTINPDLVPSAPSLSDQTGAVNTAVDITLPVGTGGDGALAYSIANLPGGLSFNTNTRKITGTPTTEETKTVTYTVTDADGDTDSETFTFTINPDLVPSAPALSDQTGVVNTAVDITLPVGTGGDGALAYSIANLPAGLSFNTGTRKITGTPTTEESKTVTYTVTDADGDTDSETFTFTISPEDLTPSAPTVSNQTIRVGVAVDITLPVGTGGNSPLAYSIANLPTGLSFNANTRKITGTPTTAQVNTVTYTVTDADNDADSSTFTFTIAVDFRISNWNGTRYLSPIVLARLTATISGADITVDPVTPLEGELVVASDLTIDGVERHVNGTQIRLRKNGDADFSTYFDNEGSPTYPTAKLFIVLNDQSFTHIPCTIGPTGGGFNNWSLDDSGQNSLINAIATGDEFLLAIAEPDVAPSAPTVANQTGVVNTAVDITLPVGTGGNGTLVYTIAGLPAGLSFNTGTRKITGTPTTAETNTVTYTVTDADGDADSETFTFTIGPEDLTPSAPTVADQTGVVGTAVDLTLPVGTGGNGILTYAIADLPTGLSFDGSTRRITGTPTTEESKTVTYTVTDADNDVDSETFTFTIGPEDLTPSAPTVDDQTGTVRRSVSILLPIGTGGNSPLAYSIANLPTGLSFNTSTRKITGTPTTPQVKTVTYTVTDADNDADSETFTFTIEDDLTPGLLSPGNQTGKVNTPVNLTLPVALGGDLPLTYAIENLPAGLVFNASTREITGTPTTAERKTVTYKVTDADGDIGTSTFTFTINPNLVPSAPSLSDQTGAVNTAVDLTLPVGTGGDGALTYAIAGLPAGLSFNTSTRKITGTPTTDQVKTVTYTVTDADGDTGSSTFTFTINPDLVPSAPSLSDQTGAVGTAVNILLPVGTGGDGALAYAIANLPAGLSFNTSTRRITGTPTAAQVKTVTYTVTDADGDSNSSTFTFTINPDLVPSAPSLSDQTGAVNTAVDITLPVGTGGNSPLAYSIANLPAGLAFNTGTRKITGTPTTAESKTVTYTVTDADSDADSETFTFTINPDLAPSAPALSDQTGAVGTAVDLTLAVGTGGDSPLSYTIANLPAGLSFNTGTRRITGTPTTAQRKTVTYTVTDADGDTDSSTFTFTIAPADVAPSAPNVADQTGTVNTALNLILAVGTGGNSPLSYAIANLPTGLSFDTRTRRITGTPSAAEVKTVTYTVTDVDGDTDSDTFIFTILANRGPIARAGDDQTVSAGSTVVLDGSASSDPDSHALTHAWTEVTNSGVTITNADSESASFVAPSRTSATILNFRLTVSDGILSSTDEIQVTVKVNQAPTVVVTGGGTADAGDTVTLDASGSSDPEGEPLTYAWTQTNGFKVPLTGADTARVSFDVPLITGQPQTLSFQVSVSDGTSSATASAQTQVNAGPSAPISQGQVSLIIEWYDKDRALISEEESPATRLGDVGLTWLRFDALFNAPLNAVEAKFKFVGEKPLQSTGNSVYMTAPYIRHIVEEDLLAPNSVTTDKIVNEAITNAKLGQNAVETKNIVDAAIINAKLGINAVETDNIVAAAITNAKLGANSVDTLNIVASAITNSEIAVSAIHADNILANAITAGQIAAGTITANEILSGTITASKIASGTITANEIAGQTITASEIASGTITANEIASQAITASEIQAGTITSDKIAANTIIALNIAASAITASELAANSVTANKIRADTITGDKITANAINANHIAANSVGASEIIANSITAGQIAAGAISATEIAVGGVNGTRIAQGSIETRHLGAEIVTAGKILLGDGFIIGTGGKISIDKSGFTVTVADNSLVLSNTGLKVNIAGSGVLGLTNGGLDIIGTITADHIDSDVRNVGVLYQNNSGVQVNNSNTSILTLTGDLDDYDAIEFVIRITNLGAYGITAIPRTAIPTSGHKFCAFSAGRGDNQNLFLELRRNSAGTTLRVAAGTKGHDGYIHSIIGIKNPGESGSSTTTPTTPTTTLRNAVAPTVSISGQASVIENGSLSLSAGVSGGTYDTLAYAWSATSGSITGSGSSVTYNAPDVSSNTTVTISVTVTANGTGTNAISGSFATRSDNHSITVNNSGAILGNAIAPTVSISGQASVIENGSLSLSAGVSGGTYDTLAYAWSATSGSITGSGSSVTYNAPDVSSNTSVTITLVVTARGTGTDAARNTSDTNRDTHSVTVSNVASPDAIAPRVSVTGSTSVGSGGTLRIRSSVSGGTYDALSYAWSSGGGSIEGSGTTVLYHADESESDNSDTITLVVTATRAGGSPDTSRDSISITITGSPDDPGGGNGGNGGGRGTRGPAAQGFAILGTPTVTPKNGLTLSALSQQLPTDWINDEGVVTIDSIEIHADGSLTLTLNGAEADAGFVPEILSNLKIKFANGTSEFETQGIEGTAPAYTWTPPNSTDLITWLEANMGATEMSVNISYGLE